MDLVELPDRAVQRHPWEVIRFAFFFRMLAEHALLDGRSSVLDAGAGDAWFADQLTARSAVGRIVCWDTGYTPEFLANRRPIEGERITLSPNRPNGQFDILLLLDVLEHVQDAERLLNTLVHENLVPSGFALISVPAWPALFSSHDLRLQHHRRYTPAAARALIAKTGLEIISSGGLFHSLLVPRAFRVARERLLRRRTPLATLHWNGSPLLTKFIVAALSCDGRLSRVESRLGWSLPGLSWWALCRRQERR